MATIADLNIRLGLLSRQFESDLRRFEGRMQAAATKLGSVGEKMTLSITAPLAAIGIGAIKTAAEFESLRLAMETTFEAVGRGAGEANAEIEALRRAALAPGLDFEQAVKGSVRLQGVGISAEKARVILSELGNALAASGGNADQLDNVTKQFTQIIGKGRLLQEDLTIILENMPALASVLREEFGTTSAEAIRELGVSAEDFIDRITNRMQTLPRVAGGLTNSIVNAGVAIRTAAARIGEEINKAFNVSGNLDKFANWISDLAERFSNLDEGTKRLILGVGVFAAALGPAIKAVSLMISAGTSLVGTYARIAESFRITAAAGTGTLGIFSRLSTAMKLSVFGAAAGIILALAAAFATLNQDSSDAAYSQELFAEAQKKVTEEVGKETAILNKNFDVLKNAASTSEQRTAAIKELQATYPGYLKNINLEGASLSALNEIQGQLNSQILRSVAERQKAIAVEAEYNKVAQAQLRINQLRKDGFDALSGEEVQRSGRSLFGTDFEKRFVLASARAEVVRDVIKALEGDIKRSTTAVTDLSQQFDKTFGIGTEAAKRQYDALTKQRQAVIDAEDALEDMTPAQREALKFAEDWDKKWAAMMSSGKSATTAATRSAELYRDALASINAVVQKGDVIGADVISEQAKEIENQIERLLENGFKPYSEEILHLRDMLKGLFDDIRVPQLEVGVSALPTIALPDQVARIDVQVAGAAEIDALTAAANRGIEAAEVFRSQWEQSADIMNGLSEGTITFSQAVDAAIQSLQGHGEGLQATFLAAAQAMGNAFAEAEGGFAKMALAAVAAGAKVIKTQIQEGVAAAVSSALKTIPFPFNLAAGAIAGGAAAALFSKAISSIGVPALAEGGVVNKPTLALIGEYPGAATDPEIVAPESKLRKIFESGDGATGKLIATVKGDDLQFVLDRAGTRRGRTR